MQLTGKQRPFALYPPPVSGKRAVTPNHAMARDGDSNVIGSTSPRHRPCALWRTDPLCDLGITRRRASRDVAQRLPYPLLKNRAAEIKRQVEPELRSFHEADDLRDASFKVGIAADQLRLGKTVLEIAQKEVGIVPEQDGANPLPGGRDQNRSQRTFS